ncbi:MAG: hypothetical protein HW421_2295 [Ignavibacteria bacterium]|nr:hypothetical protein [Ignavibacteria bacterium]
MSLIEIENSIKNLNNQEKADLVMNLLQNLETSDIILDETSFSEEIITRSKDDSAYFIDSSNVIKEAKSKYSK